MNWKNLTGLVFLAAGMSHAHLIANSLTPKTGTPLRVGDNISITWTAEQNHQDGIDIAFSKDAGTTWTDIRAGFSDNTIQNTFKWTITPASVTTEGQGMFRICQSGPCTNQKVSRPTGNGGPWILVSGNLTVLAATSLADVANAGAGLSMDFNPQTRNVEVSFALARSEDVLLQAFDTQGRLVATLIQGNYASGEHALSVFSNRLTSAGGSLVFKLQAGEQVKTLHWLSAR